MKDARSPSTEDLEHEARIERFRRDPLAYIDERIMLLLARRYSDAARVPGPDGYEAMVRETKLMLDGED